MKRSIFSRVRDVVLADLHQVLDEQEKKNPIALLNQYVRDGEGEVRKIEKLIERQKVLKTNFFRELEQSRYMEKKRNHQAVIAKEAGERELEERACKESEYYQQHGDQLESMYNTSIQQIDELEQRLQEMKNKLKEMHAKRMELMARENVAHANRRINDALTKISDDSPFLRFEEIEEYITNLERQINEDYERDTFDTKIAKLEKMRNEAVGK